MPPTCLRPISARLRFILPSMSVTRHDHGEELKTVNLAATTLFYVYGFAEPTTATEHHQLRYSVRFTQVTDDGRWRFEVAPPQYCFHWHAKFANFDRYYLRKSMALITMLKQRRRAIVHLPALPVVDKERSLWCIGAASQGSSDYVERGWLARFYDDLRSS